MNTNEWLGFLRNYESTKADHLREAKESSIMIMSALINNAMYHEFVFQINYLNEQPHVVARW